ncbi:MAG: T9SS type A sorting domain-containing protein [Owenweeksia sp.]|nr:T9SS type A sorting domain-containing protein [Owenweeksia sp.]
MKNLILFFTLFSSIAIIAQPQRYFDEVAEVKITKDVEFGVNVDFLKNSDFSNQAQVGADIQDLTTLLASGSSIPQKYFDPADGSTEVKVSSLKMDIYEPAYDVITDRPVVIYIHTGNFLPPPLNGSPLGRKTDSSAIVACTKLAKRGFVAISIDYRLGWNPAASGPTGAVVRRATLLNAVYRAIHDVKQLVRTLREDAGNTNTYGIDPDEITLYGEGSGGYVALAYATLDKQSETEISKFVYPGTMDSSYVQPSLVGDVDGLGGFLNLYTDNGQSTDINFVVNTGGALADTSWLEAGDAPMVAVQCVRDPFAPFGEGTVIVPTTQEDVVDVQGANVFMEKSNALGNNTAYTSQTYNDPITLAARSRYGNTYSYIYPPPNDQITINNNVEGLFPVLRPKGASLFQNEGAPWQWWDPNSPLATAVVDQGPPPVTAHQASLMSNPGMSPSKGRTYIDTILGYAVPRIVAALFPNTNITGIELMEQSLNDIVKIYPNPANTELFVKAKNQDSEFTSVSILTITGKPVLSVNLSGGRAAVDISDLSPGVYLVEIHREAQNSIIKKITVQ